MRLIQRCFPISENDKIYIQHIAEANPLFLDIETTGLSPKGSFIYCIGTACYTENDSVLVTLYFGDRAEDEPNILKAFRKQLSSYDMLITFNGTAFDLPFLEKRWADPHLFDKKTSLDLLKYVRSMKNLFRLPDYRQKTVEQFLGINREDTYSGKELINIYQTYVKTGDNDLADLLILHNLEDVLGMTKLLPLLSYDQLFLPDYQIINSEIAVFKDHLGNARTEYGVTLLLNTPVPVPIRLMDQKYQIALRKDKIHIQIPVYEGRLNHYLKDWKNHCYLTVEQMVVHKSVTSFMDKSVYRKAAAKECFVPKEGQFLPLFTDKLPNELSEAPLFQKDFNDHAPYLDIADVQTQFSESYIKHIIQFACNK